MKVWKIDSPDGIQIGVSLETTSGWYVSGEPIQLSRYGVSNLLQGVDVHVRPLEDGVAGALVVIKSYWLSNSARSPSTPRRLQQTSHIFCGVVPPFEPTCSDPDDRYR